MKKMFLLLLVGVLIVISCKENPKNTEADMASTMDSLSLVQIWQTDTLLTTSESVIYDAVRDVYYVSCINGVSPWIHDDDGFIARIDGEGNILEQKWVTGLSGPKGMALSGNVLYVTDIDRLVSIDVESGEISNKLIIEEAENLNDLSLSPDGTLFISDSKTSTIYHFDGESATLFYRDTLFGGLNGIFAMDGKMIGAGFVTGDLFEIDMNNSKWKKVATGMEGGDGVEGYGEGYFVSSWHGAVWYLDGQWRQQLLIDTRESGINAADIEVVEAKKMLLVPTFFDNRVVAYRIE